MLEILERFSVHAKYVLALSTVFQTRMFQIQIFSLNEQQKLVVQSAYYWWCFLGINYFYFHSHYFSFSYFYNVLSENIYLVTVHAKGEHWKTNKSSCFFVTQE